MYKIKYMGIAKKGKVILDENYKIPYLAYILRNEGKRIEITVSVESKTNSKPQQRYYRGVVVKMLADHIGESYERMHELLQPAFFMYQDSKERNYIRSTEIGEWTTVEWEERMDAIRKWAFDFHNLIIPLPNEIEWY